METRSSLSLSLSHSSHTSHYSGDENLSDVSRRCLLDCLICLFLYSLSLSLSRYSFPCPQLLSCDIDSNEAERDTKTQ